VLLSNRPINIEGFEAIWRVPNAVDNRMPLISNAPRLRQHGPVVVEFLVERGSFGMCDWLVGLWR
jgi:hypothetical protein